MDRKNLIQRLTFLLLSLGAVMTAVPAMSAVPAPGRIAFSSNRDGNFEIYTMNSDGTGVVRLTNNAGVDDFPAWSPDGSRIVYLSENSSHAYSIRLINADGTGQRTITNILDPQINANPNWIPRFRITWSPDGSKIAFCDRNDIFAINVDGTNRLNLTNNPAADLHPSWSPDGAKIVFASDRSTDQYSFRWFTMKSDGTEQHELAGGLGQHYVSEVDPEWSPDGTKLAGVWVWTIDNGVFLIRDISGNLIFIDWTTERDASTPTWSPDGTRVAYSALVYPGGNDDIFVVNADGTALKNITNTGFVETHPSWQPKVHRFGAPVDFDGDGKTDIALFRPNTPAEWWYIRSSDGEVRTAQFGLPSDLLVPINSSINGPTPVMVFRPDTAVWYGLAPDGNSFSTYVFGSPGNIPVPGDYDGDGWVDRAVFNPQTGSWFIFRSSDFDYDFMQFGAEGDRPVPADYDGDGLTDFAIVRDNAGNKEWWIQRSAAGSFATVFGVAGDKAVPGDYTGDGKIDIAVWRPGTGEWFILRSEDLSYFAFPWGKNGDIPAPGDYDGDGKYDVAVYRPSEHAWYINRTGGSPSVTRFGAATDIPVASAYVR